MSTAFYWDKEQKMPVFERRAGGLDEQRHMHYIFNRSNLIKLLKADETTLVWDEYGTPYTVASILKEIYRSGVIILDEMYFPEWEAENEKED